MIELPRRLIRSPSERDNETHARWESLSDQAPTPPPIHASSMVNENRHNLGQTHGRNGKMRRQVRCMICTLLPELQDISPQGAPMTDVNS